MKTLLILHGWQSSKEKWQKVKEIIEANGVKVVVPDLPGFKKETELRKPWNLDNYIEWTRNFIEQCTLGPVFLLGHSFGGRVAIKFAVKYPEKLSGLILVSAAGIEKKSFKLFLISKTAFFLKKFDFFPGFSLFKEFFYKKILKKRDYILAKGMLKQTFTKVISEDLTPLFSKIKVPTLILWGRKDEITHLKDAYLMKEKIENSKLEIFENVGHTPHLEAAEKLSKTVGKFLSDYANKSY